VIHKAVVFEGQQELVSRKLRDFLCSLKTPTRIIPYSTVRSATFTVCHDWEEQSWETTSSDALPVATCLPLQIFDSIRAMGNLRSLTLIIHGFSSRQQNFFYGLLQNIEIQAEFIRISASDCITRRVLEKSPQLQALHLPECIDVTHFEPIFGRLRRLCAAVGRVESGGRIQFPTINEINLKKIAERYPCLEELVLREYSGFQGRNSISNIEAAMSAFDEDFTKAIKIFRSMPGLKRVAIDIDLDIAHLFCEGNRYKEDGFYTARLLRLASCLPRLVQVGIINETPEYWTITKESSGELTVYRGFSRLEGTVFPLSVNEGF
ncbi:unnamed protein product, partial [Clonostachys rosea]